MRFETHSHSHMSNIRLIDSICKPSQLIEKAAELGYAGIALTDHEALCGHIDFLNSEKKLKDKNKIPQNFKCALGNEIYLVDRRTPNESQKYWHYILIAKNTDGHRALRELSSYSWLNGYTYRKMERVPTLKTELEAIVRKYPNSLIATSACLGSELDGFVLDLVEAERKEDTSAALILKRKIFDFIEWSKSLFGDDFYIEIAPGTSTDQKKFNKRIKPIAEHFGLKMVIGTDAHYLTAADREIHKAFLNSKDGEREVDSFYYDAHLMDDAEAYENIKSIYSKDEFNKMCENSLEIMGKIEKYEIFHSPIIPEVVVKDYTRFFDESLEAYPNLQRLRNSLNIQERYWVNSCLYELKARSLENEVYMKRLELEADVISHISSKLNNCLYSYFNTFQHYIDLFWECGSVQGPGRGSSSGFLSNYLLGITQLDPIAWELPYFRFLNKERAELPDIDVDLSPSKRPLILKKIREERGELNVVQVATFGTATAKDAIKVTARGLGVNSDIAQTMSNLVPTERGKTWPLSDCLFGNEEDERKPIKELINLFNQFPNFQETALGIESIITRRGQHASGVILYNSSPFETTALMRSPNGDVITQFELHQSEQLGDTKFDFLVTDICDKISTTLDLLQKDGYFKDLSKREIYNKILHPSTLKYDVPEMWKALGEGSVQDVFQFNTEIGIDAVKSVQPHNPIELTAANALLRLAAPEGQERPMTRYIKFKNDIGLWYKEMSEAGLTEEEQKALEPYYLPDYGVPASQEVLMISLMDEKLASFTLAESNGIRKCLAKKKVEEIPKWEEKVKSSAPSAALGNYLWETMARPQMTYSFSKNHALPYSFIGIQTLYLATQFPSIYWNCACLIVNSHSIEEDADEDIEDIGTEVDEEDDEDEVDEEETAVKALKKKKASKIKYDKIAAAIGKMKSAGINVYPPDINKSTYTYSPDAELNIIRYGISGITRVGDDVVKSIIQNRPYTSVEDFLSKVKVNKIQMVNLIKCGAFDSFGDRVSIMRQYIYSISGQKTKLNLQNIKTLIDFELFPEELAFNIKVYNFTKYLKKFKSGNNYGLDNIAFKFYESNFNLDNLISSDAESGFSISQAKWEKIYQSYMNDVRDYIKKNQQKLLEAVNSTLFHTQWNKYCLGNISKWEMDSVSFYSHNHELLDACLEDYGVTDFYKLDTSPIIDTVLYIKGKSIPIFKIERIAGTVLGRNKTKKIVTLLTNEGVVSVKIFGDVFTKYDAQLSQMGEDGHKHVYEKSWFTKGNKIIVSGIRRDNSFIAKKYKSTPWHLVEQIVDVRADGSLVLQSERAEVE